MKEQDEQYRTPDKDDRTCTREIDSRDGSVLPAEDTGFRFKGTQWPVRG